MPASVPRFWEMLEQNGYKLATNLRTPNIKYAYKSERTCALYVKASNLPDGFWGVASGRIESLIIQNDPWALILLKESEATGYFFPSKSVLANTGTRWPKGIGQGYNYRVREDLKENMVGATWFGTDEELFRNIDRSMAAQR